MTTLAAPDIRPALPAPTGRDPCAFCGKPRRELVPLQVHLNARVYPACGDCHDKSKMPSGRAQLHPVTEGARHAAREPRRRFRMKPDMLVQYRPAAFLRRVVRVIQPGSRVTLIEYAGGQRTVRTSLLYELPPAYCTRCGEHPADGAIFCPPCGTARTDEATATARARGGLA